MRSLPGDTGSGGTELPFTPNTGNDFASFLLGGVVRADLHQEPGDMAAPLVDHALYFQDDWKVSPKLTLNLGAALADESRVSAPNMASKANSVPIPSIR